MSQAGQEPIAIAYLPWADLREEFTVGPVSFWPFYEKAEQKIPDAAVRDDLERFFGTFVDNVGEPVRTVVACSIGEIGFRQFSDTEVADIAAAVDCVIFATISTGVENGVCANNNSMAPPSADRLDLSARWVWPTHDGLVVKTENSTQFWSHGKYKITRPVSIGGSFCGSYGSLLQGLGSVFGDEFPADVRERLFRSLEWFRFAHTESTAVSWLHKVVMMATGFEILLDFPGAGKRRHFIEQIDSKLHLPNSYTAEIPDGRGGTFTVCKAAEWAGSFYKLRNDITHGDPVPRCRLRYKDWITHLIVADLVMLEWVKRFLYERGCMGEHIREAVDAMASESHDPPEALEKEWLPSRIMGLDFESVHEALGWIPPFDNRRQRGPKGD
jgi:hypothetical protein